MVHGEDRVIRAKGGRAEEAVGGKGPARPDPGPARPIDRGLDREILFPPDVPALPRVRIQSEQGDLRTPDREVPAQRRVDDTEFLHDPAGGEGLRYPLE